MTRKESGNDAHDYADTEQIARVAACFAFYHLRRTIHASAAHYVSGCIPCFVTRFAGIALGLPKIAQFQMDLAAVVFRCLIDVDKIFVRDLLKQKYVFWFDVVVRILLVVEDEQPTEQLVQYVPKHNLCSV